MNVFLMVIFCIIITIGCYTISLKLFYKYKKGWLNPLFTASSLLTLLLLLFHIPEGTYIQASSIFNYLLQLAVVALAVPLYKQWGLLKENYKKILIGVIAGTVIGLLAVISMSHIFHLKEQLLASLIPRSVTLPIALTISSDLGGIRSSTIIFVISSALIAVFIGPKTLQKLGIKSKSAKGLAMGTSAQMIGASHSLVWGEGEGAMGNVAMTTTALFFSLIVPFIPYMI